MALDENREKPCKTVATEENREKPCKTVATEENREKPCKTVATEENREKPCKTVALDQNREKPCKTVATEENRVNPCKTVATEENREKPCKTVATEENREKPYQTEASLQLLLSVPKRRFKHAVDRNRVKRQLREAFRKNKHLLANVIPDGQCVVLSFIWMSDKHTPSADVEQHVVSLLKRIARKMTVTAQAVQPNTEPTPTTPNS